MSEENQEVQVSEQIVAEAKQYGWVEKENFRGDESDWIDAETFVKRGKEITPILKANNVRLQKELEDQKRQLREVKEAAEEFKEFQKEAYQRKQQDLESQIKQLKEARKQAFSDGDAETFADLEEQIDELKAEKNKPVEVKERTPEPESQELDPSLVVWLEENKWFGKDQENTETTNIVAERIRKANPNLQGKEFFDELDKRMKKLAPELYTNPNQAKNSVEGSTPKGISSSKKKSYDNLPADAKAACDKFVKQGLFKTVEEYVSLYDWSE